MLAQWVCDMWVKWGRATASSVDDDVKPCTSRNGVWKIGRYDAWCECRCMSTEGGRMEVQDLEGMSQY
jgi:hypothetical protein